MVQTRWNVDYLYLIGDANLYSS